MMASQYKAMRQQVNEDQSFRQASAPPPPPAYYEGFSGYQQVVTQPTPICVEQPPPYMNQPVAAQHFGQQMPISPSLVIIQTPNSAFPISRAALGPMPCTLGCPYCRALITTHVDYECGVCSWASFGAFIVFGLWCGCCLIPLCTNSFKDVSHRCPNCNAFLGRYSRC